MNIILNLTILFVGIIFGISLTELILIYPRKYDLEFYNFYHSKVRNILIIIKVILVIGGAILAALVLS